MDKKMCDHKMDMPNGEVSGKDLPDKGFKTGVTDTYGVGGDDLNRGYTGGDKIVKDTKSN